MVSEKSDVPDPGAGIVDPDPVSQEVAAIGKVEEGRFLHSLVWVYLLVKSKQLDCQV